MSTKNYDSSLLTKRKQAKALGAYANAIAAANNSPSGPATVRTTQPTYQSAVVVTYQNIGKCACSVDALENPYGYNVRGAAACGCGPGSS